MTFTHWKGKTALVTGASAGIGAAMARRLAAGGCNLVLTARRRERLEALALELSSRHGVRADVVPADLADPAGAQRLADALRALGRSIDLLINNAGLGRSGAFENGAWEQDLEMMQLNMVSPVHLTRLLLPQMIDRGAGDILITASIAAYLPIPTFAVYSASKAFVKSFGEALGFELRGTGVRVCVVSPGGTATEFAQVGGFTLGRMARMGTMSADKVAAIALAAMARGRRSVVAGGGNWLAATLARSLPLPVQLRAANAFQRIAGGRDTPRRAA